MLYEQLSGTKVGREPNCFKPTYAEFAYPKGISQALKPLLLAHLREKMI